MQEDPLTFPFRKQHRMPSRPNLPEPSVRQACVITALASLVVVGIALSPQRLMAFFRGEFGVVETLSAFAYLVGAWLAVRRARASHGWPRTHWVMWAALCLLFFGEETSWLQHWLAYETPAKVSAINAQEEFNLHNLFLFSTPASLVDATGARLSWKLLLSAQVLFYVGFTAYFLLLPLAMRLRSVARLGERLGIPRLGAAFLAIVWLPIGVTSGLTFAFAHDAMRKALIGETREMCFALAIAVFIGLASAAHRRQGAYRTISHARRQDEQR